MTNASFTPLPNGNLTAKFLCCSPSTIVYCVLNFNLAIGRKTPCPVLTNDCGESGLGVDLALN